MRGDGGAVAVAVAVGVYGVAGEVMTKAAVEGWRLEAQSGLIIAERRGSRCLALGSVE